MWHCDSPGLSPSYLPSGTIDCLYFHLSVTNSLNIVFIFYNFFTKYYYIKVGGVKILGSNALLIFKINKLSIFHQCQRTQQQLDKKGVSLQKYIKINTSLLRGMPEFSVFSYIHQTWGKRGIGPDPARPARYGKLIF